MAPPSTPVSKVATTSSYQLDTSSSLSSWAEPPSSSHHHHHPPGNTTNNNSNSLEENAEQVSKLFTSTITSLAADLNALKQLTTWKDILQRQDNNNNNNDDDEDSTSTIGKNGHYCDENNHPGVVVTRREEFLESLCHLDDVVTAVERKVGTLRQIVCDEQRALENLNILQQESKEQNENLQHLVARCRNMKVTTSTNNNNNNNNDHATPGAKSSARKHGTTPNNKSVAQTSTTTTKPFSSAHNHSNNHYGKTTPASKESSSNNSSNKLSSNKSAESSHSSDEHHAHADGLSCYFDPVTQEELDQVPRTTKGRVQVVVINEALANIEKCFHKKAVKERRQQQLLEESRRVALSQYEERRHLYDTTDLDDEELLRNLVVTEQELRQSCAFFSAGEGTARTVLAVLKHLKRIKQVPAKKKGLFTYKLCLE